MVGVVDLVFYQSECYLQDFCFPLLKRVCLKYFALLPIALGSGVRGNHSW